MTPESLFRSALDTRPDVPALTWYDEGTGARIELSARSLATWAAKGAGLVGDELGLGPGDRVLVDLPAHWLALGTVLGVWSAGAEVVTSGPAAAAVLGTVGDRPDADDVFTVDPADPLQLRGADDVVPGARDLAGALRPHPDRLGSDRGGPGDPALDGRTRDDVAAAAERAAAGLPAGTRLLTTPATAVDLVTDALVAWAAGGSLVAVVGAAGPERLAAIAAAEAATPL